MMPTPPPPRFAIFDLDGTLLDTEPLYTEAAQAIVGRYGKQFDWELKRRTMGGQAKVSAQIVIDALGLPLSAEEYLAERDVILQVLFERTRPMPGAPELVAAIAAAGIPLAIATSSERALCEKKLRPHAWKTAFDVIVCSDDPGVGRAKPAPDLFLAAARALGAAPEECLVFEDSPKGLEAAQAANMRCVALVDPNLRMQDFPGALQHVASLAELSVAALGLVR